MNQIERQVIFSQSSDIKIKKLRTTYGEIKYSLSNTCLENLSNELFYEIFDYLDGCDIHKAFSKLNIRFKNLFNHSLLPLKISLSSNSRSILEYQCQHIIIPNNHRIFSLHLNGCSVIQEFFNHCNIDSSFNRLESIVLNGLSSYKLMMILFYLNSLPRLFSLIIQLEQDSYYNISDIYKLIFRLPSLKYNKLSLLNDDDDDDDDESHIFIPIHINEKFSTIERLIVDFYCNLNELTSILYHIPHLRHLTCKGLNETDEISKQKVLLTLPHLTHITIGDCNVEFDVFEIFIKRISSQLQVLCLKACSDTAYLSGNRWKRLINKHMPHLCKFQFDHRISTINDDDITPNHESIIQFTSSFWIKRQWFFELKKDFNALVYSIRPYQKRWYNHDICEQIMIYSNRSIEQQTSKYLNIAHRQESDDTFIQSVQPIQLTIEDYIDDMRLCFIAVKFTHLNINCHNISTDLLLEIIHLLLNLISLEVSSFPLAHLSNLSIEDTEMLLLVSITNRITKVKLNKLDGMEQLQFLMNLCPRMQYLEIQCMADHDLESIIGFISMNNITRIPYLCCLCLCIPNANEKGIQILDTVIDFERLFHRETAFHDYVIRRVQDKIFLKWKL